MPSTAGSPRHAQSDDEISCHTPAAAATTAAVPATAAVQPATPTLTTPAAGRGGGTWEASDWTANPAHGRLAAPRTSDEDDRPIGDWTVERQLVPRAPVPAASATFCALLACVCCLTAIMAARMLGIGKLPGLLEAS